MGMAAAESGGPGASPAGTRNPLANPVSAPNSATEKGKAAARAPSPVSDEGGNDDFDFGGLDVSAAATPVPHCVDTPF
jgi:hypothetical protein